MLGRYVLEQIAPPQPPSLLIPNGFRQKVSLSQLHAMLHGNQLATAEADLNLYLAANISIVLAVYNWRHFSLRPSH
jgi:hypothetical protein